MTFILLLFAIIFVLAPLADAYAKRLKQPTDAPGLKPADVARLREELEALAAQVNRLQDEQSFMLRLLSENPPRRELEGGERPPGSRRSAPPAPRDAAPAPPRRPGG